MFMAHGPEFITYIYDMIKFVLAKWMMRGKILSDTFWFINYFLCIFMRILSSLSSRSAAKTTWLALQKHSSNIRQLDMYILLHLWKNLHFWSFKL